MSVDRVLAYTQKGAPEGAPYSRAVRVFATVVFCGGVIIACLAMATMVMIAGDYRRGDVDLRHAAIFFAFSALVSGWFVTLLVNFAAVLFKKRSDA